MAFISMSILIVACAVVVPIQGGPKDIIPPKVVRSAPANFSTNFTGQRIVITFNKFVALKDIDKQKLISPPMIKDPEFKLKGKSLVITFKEPLQKDATYSIYMGNAIVDITEGNPLAGYSFVFSTGSSIDSLGMNGNVVEALDQKPPKDALAMLYEGTSDSLPYLTRPLYVARVSDSGDFRLNNLRKGHFKLIILQDLNSNYLYDKGEAIAFADTLLPAHRLEPQKLDSLGKPVHIKMKTRKGLVLSMFKESDSVQRVLRAAMVAPNHLQITARLAVKKPKLEKVVADNEGPWYLGETNATRDTLDYWLKNIKSDSLHFILRDGDKSLDTLNISIVYKGKNALKAARSGVKQKLRLKLNVANGGSFALHSSLMLLADNPLKKADFSTFKLIQDSVAIQPKAEFSDSLKRRIIINNILLEGAQYQLIIPDSVFEDIYGSANDSIAVKFKTRTLKEYGSLRIKVHMKDPQSYVVQLLSADGKVVKEDRISADGKIEYPYLLPGKYKLKAIQDTNRNGRWDTGNYLRHLQPEHIIVFPKVLDLRANWEQDEDWEL